MKFTAKIGQTIFVKVPEVAPDTPTFTSGEILKVKISNYTDTIGWGGYIIGTNHYLLQTDCAFLYGRTSQDYLVPSFPELLNEMKKSSRFFTVWFIKKDGTERRMTCKFGVTKHLKGGKSNLDGDKFFIVWDCGSQDYRAVNKETIFKVKINGVIYEE